MPDYPSYIHRLTAILTEAQAPKPIPFFRRGDIEALFGLRKRQALHLMHRIGALRVSRELAVRQEDLVAWLERQLTEPGTAAEWRRHERVIGRIIELKAETRARAVKITLPDPAPAVEGLPEGVALQPGLLTVAFESEEQLLARLFQLAQLLATDPAWLSERAMPRG